MFMTYKSLLIKRNKVFLTLQLQKPQRVTYLNEKQIKYFSWINYFENALSNISLGNTQPSLSLKEKLVE